MDEARQPRETAGLTTSLVVGYVRKRCGESAVLALLAEAGERRPASALEDPRTWSSYQQKIALFEAAERVTGDTDVALNVGSSVLELAVGRRLQRLLRALGSPERLLASVARAHVRFSTSATMWAESLDDRTATVAYRLHDGYEPSRHDCDYNRGLLSQVPVLFGAPEARIEHPTCQLAGDDACRYVVRWSPARWRPWAGARPAPDAHGDVVGDLDGEQRRALERTVSELMGPASLDTVLQRIVQRAADAVHAHRYLLVVEASGGRHVHAEGIDEGEARQLADELLDVGRPPPSAGSALVSVIASRRRRYGQLVALLPPDSGFLPDEQEHLDTYAVLAAAAIDATEALGAERRHRRANDELLALSRRLAIEDDEGRIADQVVAVVPQLTGADRASLMLWDDAAGCYVTAAAFGFGVDTPARLDLTISPEATGLIERLHNERVPVEVAADAADEHLEALLQRFGHQRVLVAPLVDGGRLLGALVASLIDDRPLDEVATAALRGLADQATLAVVRRRLLAEARHLATHDRLTGLPGRELLHDRIERAVADHRRRGQVLAVAFLDLDGFKTVNDRHGHAVGDALLEVVAERLSGCVRSSDTVARLAGDEFVVVLRDLADAGGVARVLACIREELTAPVTVRDAEVQVGVSVGVSAAPSDGVDPEELLMEADRVMYIAKARGGGIELAPGAVRALPELTQRLGA